MKLSRKDVWLFLLLFMLLISSCFFHLFAGDIPLSVEEYYGGLMNSGALSTHELIAREFRIPRVFMALIAGGGLSLSGMLMQTLFNNPLAGPYVLGINAGSSLFVAFSLMTGLSFFATDGGIIASALLGALVFGFVILGFSLVVRSHISLLLIGLMLGSFTGSIVSVLQSSTSSEELKSFTMWTMGSLQQVQFQQLPIICFVFAAGLFAILFLIKPLNILVLGDKSVEMLGLSIKRIRVATISVTALFTGLVTAFCGPIAFVGLAVPALAKRIFRTQAHGKLLLANVLLGALFLVTVDTLIQLLEPYIQLPINAFTSMIGAPLVILFLVKKIK
jgi:iron complex transport system permease protein